MDEKFTFYLKIIKQQVCLVKGQDTDKITYVKTCDPEERFGENLVDSLLAI